MYRSLNRNQRLTLTPKPLKTYAYAKINLGLRVWGKREDGYHDVTTIMQRISLCDTLILSPLEGAVEYQGPQLTPAPEDNLCVRAARVFQKRFGEEFGVRIELEKNIPTGAGLGGGSSDAASMLKGMAQLYAEKLSMTLPSRDNLSISSLLREALLEAAAELGSDVPFFIEAAFDHLAGGSGSRAALAQGRGELLTPVTGLYPDLTIVIIYPGFEISTAGAYRSVDEYLTFTDADIILANRIFLHYAGGIPEPEMGNDFEKPVFSAHPELAQARGRLLEAGAWFAGLSGSGSALFGVFDGEAANRIQRFGLPAVDMRGARQSWLSFVCRPF